MHLRRSAHLLIIRRHLRQPGAPVVKCSLIEQSPSKGAKKLTSNGLSERSAACARLLEIARPVPTASGYGPRICNQDYYLDPCPHSVDALHDIGLPCRPAMRVAASLTHGRFDFVSLQLCSPLAMGDRPVA